MKRKAVRVVPLDESQLQLLHLSCELDQVKAITPLTRSQTPSLETPSLFFLPLIFYGVGDHCTTAVWEAFDAEEEDGGVVLGSDKLPNYCSNVHLALEWSERLSASRG